MTNEDTLFLALMVNLVVFCWVLYLYYRLRHLARVACEKARMPFTWLEWIEADRICCDEARLPDEAVVLTASVGGGGMWVEVGHLREGAKALGDLYKETL